MERKTTRRLRQDFTCLDRVAQEAHDQEGLHVKHLLALPVDKIYTLSDLKNEHILERALRLLYLGKFGQKEVQACISRSPHI